MRLLRPLVTKADPAEPGAPLELRFDGKSCLHQCPGGKCVPPHAR